MANEITEVRIPAFRYYSSIGLSRRFRADQRHRVLTAPVVHRIGNGTLAMVGGWYATMCDDGTVNAIYAGAGYAEVDPERLKAAIKGKEAYHGFVELPTYARQDVSLYFLEGEEAHAFGCDHAIAKIGRSVKPGALLVSDGALLHLVRGGQLNPLSSTEPVFDTLPVEEALAEARSVGRLGPETPYGPNVAKLTIEHRTDGPFTIQKVLVTRRGTQRGEAAMDDWDLAEDPFASSVVFGAPGQARPALQLQAQRGNAPKAPGSI